MSNKRARISEEEYDPKIHVKEIKCKCNECGKVWHYLESEVKKLKDEQTKNACISVSTFGCIPSQAYFLGEAQKKEKQAKELNKCPNCGSWNVTKTVIYYKKEG